MRFSIAVKRAGILLLCLVLSACSDQSNGQTSEPARESVNPVVFNEQGLALPANKLTRPKEMLPYLLDTQCRIDHTCSDKWVKYRSKFEDTIEGKKKALVFFKELAEKGDVNAQTFYASLLSLVYPNHPEKLKEAKRWAEKAAAAGSESAIYDLGRMYVDGVPGIGLDKDFGRAKELFKKANENGYVPAGLSLALAEMALKNYPYSAEALQDYVDKGWEDAYIPLATHQYQGWHVKKDEAKAVATLRQGWEEMRSRDALYEVALNYLDGFHDGDRFIQDEEKGREFLAIAAKNNHPRSMGKKCVLDYLAKQERGNFDFSAEVALCKESAARGEVLAYGALSDIYGIKDFPGYNLEKSKKYLLMGVEAGDGMRAYLLGRNYFYGKNGFEKDPKKAFKYLNQAAHQGIPVSMAMLGAIYKSGEVFSVRVVGKDLAKCVYWIETAIKIYSDYIDRSDKAKTGVELLTDGKKKCINEANGSIDLTRIEKEAEQNYRRFRHSEDTLLYADHSILR